LTDQHFFTSTHTMTSLYYQKREECPEISTTPQVSATNETAVLALG